MVSFLRHVCKIIKNLAWKSATWLWCVPLIQMIQKKWSWKKWPCTIQKPIVNEKNPTCMIYGKKWKKLIPRNDTLQTKLNKEWLYTVSKKVRAQVKIWHTCSVLTAILQSRLAPAPERLCNTQFNLSNASKE